MTRDDAIEYLTGNCSVWSGGDADKATLNGFDDAKLAALVSYALEHEELEKKVTTLGEQVTANAALLGEAKKLVDRQKTAIVDRLTTNHTDKAAKEKAAAAYMKMTWADLQDIAPPAAPTANAAGDGKTDYSGQNLAPTDKQTPTVNRNDKLEIPSLLDIPDPTETRRK